jgi:hypothetical protein
VVVFAGNERRANVAAVSLSPPRVKGEGSHALEVDDVGEHEAAYACMYTS